jgi:SagB-type dehydrogenase family enzyme
MAKNKKQDASTVFEYHERTKHHLHRSARSPGFMDWDNQPNPFRFYEGAKRIRLPLIHADRARLYQELYERPHEVEPIRLESIGALLELSLGLSAWKNDGFSKWSLRMNPSSGNLHPTECYLILPEMEGAHSCLAHYSPYLHCLEVRSELDKANAETLSSSEGFGIVLTSIYWREAWKYGERAFRYCNHDVGHAVAALCFSANLLGWTTTLVRSVSSRDLDEALGLDRISWPDSEEEHADCFCWVGSPAPSVEAVHTLLSSCKELDSRALPNQLSRNPVSWDVIESVSEATRSPGQPDECVASEPITWTCSTDSPLSAETILRRRRSALAYDYQRSVVDRETFLTMMERTLPVGYAPFDSFPFEPQVHLALFVHQVEGLASGLYFLLRNPGQRTELQSLLAEDFSWEAVAEDVPLYLLRRGDFREQAMMISCRQSIAGLSAFSMGMVTRFRPLIEESPWRYPQLFWETGMVGQVLYIESEAHGLRGTGIGCFYDDEMHRLLGLHDDTYQSLYHFTVGYPVDDPRLQTLAPYHHLDSRRASPGTKDTQTP